MTLQNFLYITYVVCLSYFLILTVYHLCLLFIAFFEDKKCNIQHKFENYNIISDSKHTIPVSIIVSALNEEKTILNCVKAMLNLIYPEYEIILINDGSKDKTLDVLIKEFDLKARDLFYKKRFETSKIIGIYKSNPHPNITVINKINGGKKAEAVNIGLDFAKYRYVCLVDADTVLEKDALLKTMRPVLREPDKVVGVGSVFGILNGFEIKDGRILKRSFSHFSLENYQTLEYIRNFIGNRLAWSKLGSMLCLSGGFGVWRKDFLYELGGCSSDFTCEDLELTFRAHDYIIKNKRPYKIIMLPYSVAWTEGPNRIKNLISQRNRWQRVTNETVLHYRHMLFNPKYGLSLMAIVVYFLFYEVLGVFFEIGSLIATAVAAINGYLVLNKFLVLLSIIILSNTITTLVSLFIYDKSKHLFSLMDTFTFIILSFFEFFGYRQIILLAKIFGTIDFIRKDKNWYKFERITTVSSPT